MAEFIMKHHIHSLGLDEQFSIASAATTREEIGNDMYPPAKRKLTAMGVPFTRRAARLLTRSDYREFDYIIGMDEENRADMLRICGGDPEKKISNLLDWTPRKGASVAVPWYTGNFDITYDDILEGCISVVTALRKNQ